jgi:acyl carrier protein
VTDEQIIERLSGVFQDVIEGVRFELDVGMDSVPEWDSLTHTQLLMAIEEAFSIELQFEDAIEMISGEAIVGKIRRYVEKA